MPVRPVFERRLLEARDDLLRLLSMADQAIINGVRSLVERNAALARQVSANDAALNQLRFAIEENCYEMLATQQPNATDLRVIVGTVSVATNLERIGDHAAGIARLALRMIDRPGLRPLAAIPQMAEISRSMVKDAVRAFADHDAALAEQVIAHDAQVDQLHARVYEELIAIMTDDNSTIERATFLLWVSHNLERIGDRATNICERAIYVATGHLREYRGHF